MSWKKDMFVDLLRREDGGPILGISMGTTGSDFLDQREPFITFDKALDLQGLRFYEFPESGRVYLVFWPDALSPIPGFDENPEEVTEQELSAHAGFPTKSANFGTAGEFCNSEIVCGWYHGNFIIGTHMENVEVVNFLRELGKALMKREACVHVQSIRGKPLVPCLFLKKPEKADLDRTLYL